jgi:hypothetical protein
VVLTLGGDHGEESVLETGSIQVENEIPGESVGVLDSLANRRAKAALCVCAKPCAAENMSTPTGRLAPC